MIENNIREIIIYKTEKSWATTSFVVKMIKCKWKKNIADYGGEN